MIHLKPSSSYLLKSRLVPAEILEMAGAIDLLRFDAQGEAVKELRKCLLQASSSPLGETRLLIIENAHNLTEVMQNTLLKILEEPYPHLIIVVQTHLANKLLPTVRSRLIQLAPTVDSEIAEGEAGSVEDLRKARDREELGRLLHQMRAQIRVSKKGESLERHLQLEVLEQAISRVERNCNSKLIIDSLLLHWPVPSGKQISRS